MAATAAAMLALYEAAIEAVLTKGQSYQIKDRRFTRADLQELEDKRAYWEMRADRAARGGGIRVRGVTPTS